MVALNRLFSLNFWRDVFFVRLLTSSQWHSYCYYFIFSLDPPLVQHLPSSWWPEWQLNPFSRTGCSESWTHDTVLLTDTLTDSVITRVCRCRESCRWTDSTICSRVPRRIHPPPRCTRCDLTSRTTRWVITWWHSAPVSPRWKDAPFTVEYPLDGHPIGATSINIHHISTPFGFSLPFTSKSLQNLWPVIGCSAVPILIFNKPP